ncbi:MAG: hypothetical protein GXY47_06210 [Acidobacteria bacterium]|nr:hypothetical protein [Acidobacteriota bacterium]
MNSRSNPAPAGGANVRARLSRWRDSFVARWWRSQGDFVRLLERACGATAGRRMEGSALSGEERDRALRRSRIGGAA